MKARLISFFISSSGVLILFTALAKLISSIGRSQLLWQAEPVTGMPFRNVFWIIGAIEISIALFCFIGKRPVLQAGLIAWFATMVGGYRMCLIWIGYHKPCVCLGNFTDALRIPALIADTAMKAVLAYLLIGSYSTLLWAWNHWSKAPTAKTLLA